MSQQIKTLEKALKKQKTVNNKKAIEFQNVRQSLDSEILDLKEQLFTNSQNSSFCEMPTPPSYEHKIITKAKKQSEHLEFSATQD